MWVQIWPPGSVPISGDEQILMQVMILDIRYENQGLIDFSNALDPRLNLDVLISSLGDQNGCATKVSIPIVRSEAFICFTRKIFIAKYNIPLLKNQGFFTSQKTEAG